MLSSLTNELIDASTDATLTDVAFRAALQGFLDATEDASRDEVNAELTRLAPLIELEDPARAGLAALVAGTLVDGGYEHGWLEEPLACRMGSLLESAARLADACLETMGAGDSSNPQSDDDPDDDEEPRFQAARGQLAQRMPAESAAWDALEAFWPSAVAVYSRSPRIRESSRSQLEAASRLAPYHDAGHWLTLLLSVVDNEPILVIEPQRRVGVVGRLSGVAENCQLNILLMGTFPQRDDACRRRVPDDLLAVAVGDGPQTTEHDITGRWDLFDFHAVRGDLKLPGKKESEHWIWNEGIPADIPVFEGHRVVLLGPASHPRNWAVQRLFRSLRARLEWERRLSFDEVRDWLRRMARAG